jgi:3-oxoacyl-(acyl-carrier-protein) synthase
MTGPDSQPPGLLGWGELDSAGIRGGGTARPAFAATWTELEAEAPGGPRAFLALFGRRDPTFRRLDPMSRALVMAVEATGLDDALDEEQRRETALVVQTSVGCLDADLRFARTLGDEVVDGPLFAYTLPSTSLGEVALRHGLRGPSLCLSVEESGSSHAWIEARAMLRARECGHAVVAHVDALIEPHGSCAPRCRARAVLVDVEAEEDLGAWLAGCTS